MEFFREKKGEKRKKWISRIFGKKSGIAGLRRLGFIFFGSGLRDLSNKEEKRRRSYLFLGKKFGFLIK